MDWIYLFSSFSGRISRLPFWIGFAILVAVETTTQWLASQTGGETLGTILDLAFTYPEFALAVKRTNDRNLSPWVVGLFFAFNVALDLFTLLNGNFDMNNPINEAIAYPFGLFALILLIELGFRRGTSGPNRFGPDSLNDGKPTLLSQYAVVRWLSLWLEALVPAEPIFLGDWKTPNYPEELPRSVKHWCFTITAVNAVVCVVASFLLRSFGPALVFVFITALGPIGMMLSWKRAIRRLNRGVGVFRARGPLAANLSAEWCAIFALLGTPFFMIVFIVAVSAD
ncbi:MAG TPA: DUF805 domain-containing protein [Xanthobacteraceae bacterium]